MDTSALPVRDVAHVRLGEAISSRAGEVAERVLAGRRSGRSDPYVEQNPADVLRTCRLTTEQIGRWLATGQVTSPEENAQLDASAESAAAGARTLAQVTKNYLIWRDSVLDIAREEAERLNTPDEVLSELVTAVRQSNDTSLVRMARRFDAVRRELETQLRAEREQLDFLALHDALTGLANRLLLLDRLGTALSRLARGSSVTVLFIDVDEFKPVNDRLGHAAGDRLLTTLAERLRSRVRPSDTVARLGGDEFVVVCPELPRGRSGGQALAARLRATTEEPFDLGEPVFVTLSVGIAVGRAGATPEQVLASADKDMYATKQRGREPGSGRHRRVVPVA